MLIVACPCALALAAPFTLGTAQRLLAKRDVLLKNAPVAELLARVDAVVFDKTGTLTANGAGSVPFHGPPLSAGEQQCLRAPPPARQKLPRPPGKMFPPQKTGAVTAMRRPPLQVPPR